MIWEAKGKSESDMGQKPGRTELPEGESGQWHYEMQTVFLLSAPGPLGGSGPRRQGVYLIIIK